jgi:mRNA interferase MazF
MKRAEVWWVNFNPSVEGEIQAYVTLKGKRSKAMADQLTTVNKQHLINKAGSLSSTDMQNVARAITTQLDL